MSQKHLFPPNFGFLFCFSKKYIFFFFFFFKVLHQCNATSISALVKMHLRLEIVIIFSSLFSAN